MTAGEWSGVFEGHVAGAGVETSPGATDGPRRLPIRVLPAAVAARIAAGQRVERAAAGGRGLG